MRFTETGADSSVAIESGSVDVICERSGMPLPPTTAVSCLLSESSFSAEAFRVVAASPNEDCTSDRLPVMSPDRPDMLAAVAASPSALAVPSVIFLEASPMLSATFCSSFCVFCAC